MSFREFYSAQRQKLPVSLSSDECRGKTYIVTGANIGLGYECTKHLVQFDAAKVIMAVRNVEAGEASRTAIEAATGRKNVLEVWRVDLSSYESVKSFVSKVEAKLERVDALVENAAVAMDRWVEKEGRELCLTTNVFATLLMTVLILPFMEKTATKFEIQPRISIIGSNAAFMIEKTFRMLNIDNIFSDLTNRKKWEPKVADVYPMSKLLLHFAYRELAARAPVSQTKVVINLSNPGVCYTGLTRNVAFSTSLQIDIMRMILGRTAEKGSRTLLYGIAAGDNSHGKYLTECEVKDEAMPAWMKDVNGQKIQKQVWKEVTEILESIQPGCLDMLQKK